MKDNLKKKPGKEVMAARSQLKLVAGAANQVVSLYAFAAAATAVEAEPIVCVRLSDAVEQKQSWEATRFPLQLVGQGPAPTRKMVYLDLDEYQ